ncbi:hypothetical protein [Oceanobacillus sp. J11TS1]|uniref:hypothetical protein n=1 Tax=Oceanobacillus sp. J11TS1 TaxID=2807191 RepID=UPI001B1D1073|nr:hypothetical protein [Oceanobacillus sp. J11TS1]GIO23666.1 hypothetical protein J11TS1_22470 [Oceanobacillus sp. J11TS1]
MRKKLFPIYREVDQKAEGFTLLLDTQSQHVYKVTHEKKSDYKFWIAWALVLALLKGIESLHLSMGSPLNILIVIVLLIISAGMGVYKYKETHKGGREVYYTQDMLEEYIEKGKSTLKGDVIVSIIAFLVFSAFMALFLIYQWLIWLLFALFIFYLFSLQLCHLSPERIRLYRRRS